jgi:type II secretory pathway pseudopilin PulG
MDKDVLSDDSKVSQKAFTLLELLMTIGVLVALLISIGSVLRRDISHKQLSMALMKVKNLLSLAVTIARLDHLYVRILWDDAGASSDRAHRVFLLTSTQIGPDAEWTLVRSEDLPEHCWWMHRFEAREYCSGEVVNVSESWLCGTSATLDAGNIPVRECFWEPSGMLRDATGNIPSYRSIGVGYGKSLSHVMKNVHKSPVGCIFINANGNIRVYEGIDAIQEMLAAL